MVRGKNRTHSKIIRRKRTPGGTLKTYRVLKKKAVTLKCSNCGKRVQGTKINASSKTVKRPSRKYPELCATCSRNKVRQFALEE